jgi:hypothetical protein
LVEAFRVLSRDECNDADSAISHLSAQSRALLLKWYNGNPDEAQEDATKRALMILHWCLENSGIFLYPPQMRRSVLGTAAREFDISVQDLSELMVKSSALAEHRETDGDERAI